MKITWKYNEAKWRRQLLAQATGDVLEVSIGTGENFNYYPKQVKVTGTDLSARMIHIAKQVALDNGVSANFIVSSSEELEFNANSFDTVVSSFSIAEYEDPLSILSRFGEWCKPDGKVLLLEQGLSNYRLIRTIQKKFSTSFYRKSGIHIDRDIIDLVKKSNLDIKKIEKKIAGIIYIVCASPKKV